ncbi:MAG: ATP-binding cassette domain-containing protein, partial [Oxalobacteraceae bacterium]
MSAVLTIERLCVSAPGGAPLLRDVSVSVAPGRPLTILGETGSGKSLVVDAAMGTLAPELRATGRIAVDGVWADADDRGARQDTWGRRLALL